MRFTIELFCNSHLSFLIKENNLVSYKITNQYEKDRIEITGWGR